MFEIRGICIKKRVELILKEVCKKLAQVDLNSDQSLHRHIKLSLFMTTIIYAVLADTRKERVLRLPEM